MRRTSTTPLTSFLESRASQIASATWSTCIGGITRAFAIDSRDEELNPAVLLPNKPEKDKDRRTLDGVGIPRGNFRCSVEDRSSRAAAGVDRGRWCAW